nr:hypothetical protein [Schwartzia sp. (in: firmicutes)]
MPVQSVIHSVTDQEGQSGNDDADDKNHLYRYKFASFTEQHDKAVDSRIKDNCRGKNQSNGRILHFFLVSEKRQNAGSPGQDSNPHIQDEFDEERPVVERRAPLIYSVDAKLPIDEINDILELSLEIDNVDTIGGWVYAQGETPPKVGQFAWLDGNAFFVEEVDNVRITRVLVRLKKELTEEHEEIKGDVEADDQDDEKEVRDLQ